jgi:uncharacterized repeat protein (TIGR04138 family)
MRELESRLWEVVERDDRYRIEAYLFLLAALELASRRLRREGHVSGQELLLAVRDLARRRFGQLAPTVFRGWGMEGCIDFGHVVLNLVDAGILSVRPEETLESFANVFDFDRDFTGLGPVRP